MSVNATVHEHDLAPSRPGQGRWKIGAGILLLAILAQLTFWTIYSDDRTNSKMSILFVWPAALFALAIWWTFFSGQSWWARLAVWGVIGLAFVVFTSLFEMDAADGEMVPAFRPRWIPSGKAQAAAYLASKTNPGPLKPMTDESVEQELWTAQPRDWPGFRGPNRDGIVTGVKLRRDWEQRPLKELWRHPIGLGWSAFSIVGDIAFTQEQRGENECVVAYKLDDGAEVWVHSDPAILKIIELNGDNGPHATPEFHEGRLYTLGGTGLLNCLDARTGRKIWQRDILKDGGSAGEPIKNIEWGMSGSPLIVDDLVIASPGGFQDRATIAYNRQTGDIVWAGGKYQAGYASPQLATLHGVRQVIVFHGEGIAGHDLASGRPLWDYEWKNSPRVNAAQPIAFQDGSVLFGCSYGVGSARIDLMKRNDEKWETQLRWKTSKFRPKFNDFVLQGEFVYGLDDGILTCLHAGTGKQKWKNGRFGYGQLLLVEDLLLILSEKGELVLVEATPDAYREVARMQSLDSICWNHLAIAHGKLLVRNNHLAAGYDLE